MATKLFLASDDGSHELEMKYSGTAASGNDCGLISFKDNSNTYVKILAECQDATGSSQDGKLSLTSLVGNVDHSFLSFTGSNNLTLEGGDGADILVGPTLADGKTLKLGKTGATEMVFTPHDTPANEKISLTNTSGDAADAISITATTGSLDLNAGDNVTIDAADEISITTSSADGHITLTSAHTAGVAFHIDANAAADSEVQIDAGILDIDVTAGATIDAVGLVLNGGASASSFSVTTGAADAKDLTFAVLGGGDSSLLLTSSGTGSDAISIDASFGSMLVGPSLADGQTLKLGNMNSTEMVFTPHGTPADEKISLTNISGDAADAISITSIDGGISLSVADEKYVNIDQSLKLTSITAPSTTTNQLYNVGGTLTWDGTSLTGGGGSSTLNGLDDVIKNITNFTGSLLIQPDSGNSAPSMTGSLSNAINNIGIGDEVFEVLSSGTDNTCLGHDAGKLITTGTNNTCVGSGTVIAAAVNNQTAIGNGATCNAVNQTVLGNGATGSGSNEITLGNASVTALRCADTTIASLSDQRDKTDIVDSSYGLDFVSTLRPVQFKWDRRNLYPGDDTSGMNGKTRVGFIAQELQAAMPANENDVLDLVYDVNPERIEAKYGNLIPILTKAVQDLSAANDALVARVAALESA